MCEPSTIAMSLMAVGGAYSAYSQYQAGQANSEIAENNALVQEYLAKDALDRGEEQVDSQRLKTRQLRSTQKALMGASGVSVGSNSFQDILTDTDVMGELDVLRIRDNAEREAWGHRQGAQDTRTQGALNEYNATAGAIGTILSTGAQTANMYKPSYKKTDNPTDGTSSAGGKE